MITDPDYPMLAVAGFDGLVVASGESDHPDSATVARPNPEHEVAMIRVQSPDGTVDTATLLLEKGEDVEATIEQSYWHIVGQAKGEIPPDAPMPGDLI